jgi:hypothetical protein
MVIPLWHATNVDVSVVTVLFTLLLIASVAEQVPPENVGFCSSTE